MRQVIGKGMLATAAATSILSLSGGSSAFAAGADAVATDSPGILSGNSVQAPLDVPVNACGNTVDAGAGLNPAFGNNCANSEAPSKGHASAPHRATPPKSAPHRATPPKHAAPREDGGYGDAPDTHAPPASHADTHPGPQHADTYPDTYPGTQSVAQGSATNSPGVLSGNNAQAPADVPVNACGNTVDVIALLNPAFGNTCANGAPAPKPPRQETPPQHETPPSHETPPQAGEPPVDRAVPQPPVRPTVPPQHVASSTDREMPSVAPAARHAAPQLAETGSDQDLLAAAAASAALLIGGGILYRRGFASSGR
ncbi:chaplin family protein [Streptomyces sp. NPDC058644]|uniref:chaplin n=2 Tax=Streptomyces TaxID=1883 RepID=UPI00365B2AE9